MKEYEVTLLWHLIHLAGGWDNVVSLCGVKSEDIAEIDGVPVSEAGEVGWCMWDWDYI